MGTLRRVPVVAILVLAGVLHMCSQPAENVTVLVDSGEFSKAREIIHEQLRTESALTDSQKLLLQFELERMERIEKDFTKTEAEVREFIVQYIPDVSDADLRRWECEKSLEYKVIDGEKRYFDRAARNFFRIDPEAKKIWAEAHKDNEDGESFDLNGHISDIMNHISATGERYNNPVRMRITYSITVDADAVPAGEIVRCWIPFPRKIPERQMDIDLLSSTPAQHIITPNDLTLQRTVYLEKPAQADEKTTFSVEYEYTSYGSYVPIDPAKVQPVEKTAELAPYLEEVPPHVVYTEKLRKISEEVVGDETNPYRVAQKLFARVDAIPWASAREYSTFRNISEYCITNGHGDCGIQTLTFMTLCRMNGIPTRWQSGWEFKPPDDTMHDWGQIYFEPYGWVPMDVTYGQRETEDEALRWFYLSGMDSYRLIFNDAYSEPLYPAKIHPRSETVDSQRGEVEWRGGNLYFDQWSWDIDWEVL